MALSPSIVEFYISCLERTSINFILFQEKKKKESEGQSSENASDTTNKEDKEEQLINLRPLNMEDMRQAKSQVGLAGIPLHKWLHNT